MWVCRVRRIERELLDVEAVAGHLLPQGSVFAFLAGHRQRLFPAEMFADLFPSGRGRPSVPAEVIASVIVLQTLHGLSDREAADAVTFDLRWKAACGYAIDAAGFHPTTLTYWRRRLAASERPQRIFEAVRDVITATGAVAGKHRRALDSTVLDDAVARQDTVTQLIAAIRRVGRDVAGAKDLIGVHCTRLAAQAGQDYSNPGKPRIAWDDPAARDELVTALVNDAHALLAALDVETIDEDRWETRRGGRAAGAGGRAGRGTGRGLRRHRRPVADRPQDRAGPDDLDRRPRCPPRPQDPGTATRRVQGPCRGRTRHRTDLRREADQDQRPGQLRRRRRRRARGRRPADAEDGPDTCESPITDDIAEGRRRVLEVLGDSAYATGDMLHTLDRLSGPPLLKPWPLRPAVPGGFTLDDFTTTTRPAPRPARPASPAP